MLIDDIGHLEIFYERIREKCIEYGLFADYDEIISFFPPIYPTSPVKWLYERIGERYKEELEFKNRQTK